MFYNRKSGTFLSPTVNTSFSCSFNRFDVVTTSGHNLNWSHISSIFKRYLNLASLCLD